MATGERIVEVSRRTYVELSEVLLPVERWVVTDIGKPNTVLYCGYDEFKKLIFVPKPDEPTLPNRTMQDLIDVGFNAFGLQLFAESVAGKTDAKTFNPFTFKFRNIKITLAPDGDVDTSHH